MKEILVIINKYGVNALLVAAVFWLNSRLSDVENRLYNCYDKLSVSRISQVAPIFRNNDAILPDPIKIKHES